MLCSPFTLFAVLAVVRQAVDSFALQRSTDQILELLARFSAQWDKLTDAIDTLGRRLESAGRAYEELSGPRRRQLQRLVDRVDDLRRNDEVGAPAADAEARPAAAPAAGSAAGAEPESAPLDVPAPPLPLRRPTVVEQGDVRALARRLTG